MVLIVVNMQEEKVDFTKYKNGDEKMITEKEIFNQRKVRNIFQNSTTELLKEDLEHNTFPEYEHIIKNIIKQRERG